MINDKEMTIFYINNRNLSLPDLISAYEETYGDRLPDDFYYALVLIIQTVPLRF